GNARLDYSSLLGGDAGERLPEPLLVVELDVRNDACQGRDDIGRVQAATQAGFPNHEVATLFREIAQRHDGNDFEERRMVVRGGPRKAGARRSVVRVWPSMFQPRLHPRHQPANLRLRNGLAIDLNALAEGNQVRGSEETNAKTC